MSVLRLRGTQGQALSECISQGATSPPRPSLSGVNKCLWIKVEELSSLKVYHPAIGSVTSLLVFTVNGNGYWSLETEIESEHMREFNEGTDNFLERGGTQNF